MKNSSHSFTIRATLILSLILIIPLISSANETIKNESIISEPINLNPTKLNLSTDTQLDLGSHDLIETSKLKLEGFEIEIPNEDVVWAKKDNEFYPVSTDISKYDIATNSKTGIKTPTMKPLSNFTFKVNKLEESECTKTFYEEDCKISSLDFTDFETKNNITKKTIKGNNPDLMTCILDANIIFVWEIRSCLNRIDNYDIYYEGTITTLDPSLQVTYTSANPNLIFTNATSVTQSIGVSTNAPVLFMNFNKPNESTGAVTSYVQDNSLYNNFGLLGNTTAGTQPTYNSTGGYDGSGAYMFDGVNDYIDTGNLTLTDSSSTPYTLSAWIKSANTNPETYAISKNNGKNIGTTNGKIFAYATTGYLYGSSASNNTWYHVSLVNNITHLNLYINGIYVNSSLPGTLSNAYTLKIGAWSSASASNFFNGSIDQVQIFDRALSASEVLNLYNGTNNNSNYIGKYARDGDFKSLVFYNATTTYWNTTLSLADTYSTRTGIVTSQGINTSDLNLVSYWALDGNYRDTSSPIVATGGTITYYYDSSTGKNWTIHRFTSNDTFTVVSNPQGKTVEALVVAGGGSGGASESWQPGGGGGAGGVIYNTSVPVTAQAYTVTIGSGGTGTTSFPGNNGTNSSFGTLQARGGGAGVGAGTYPAVGRNGNAGGSGGGAGAGFTAPYNGAGGSGTSGQGSNGGAGYWSGAGGSPIGSGGGGGAGAVGAAGTATSGGNGGAGLSYSINGSSVTYAGGGGAGSSGGSSYGAGGSSIGGNGCNVGPTLGGVTNGVINTGSGGGGSCSSAGTVAGGNGGSGIVIVRYANNDGVATGTNNASGLSSGAMRFDGTDDYVNVSNSQSVNISTPNLSVSFWIIPYSTVLNGIVSKANYVSAWNGYQFELVSGKMTMTVGNGTSSRIGRTYPIISANQPYHILGVWNQSGEITIYINGINQINSSDYGGNIMTTSIANNNPFNIGRHPDATYPRYFNGSIDEVAIWNKSLSASEVQAIYKAGLSQKANTNVTLYSRTATGYNLTDTGLVSQWDFNGNNANDAMGRNNGTASGTVFNEGNGTVGYGGYFDGVDDYIQVPQDSSINFTGNFSIGSWVKFTTPQQNKGIVAKYRTGSTSRSWTLITDQASVSGKFSFIALPANSFDTAYMTTTANQYNDGAWHYVVGVVSIGSPNRIYVDGFLDGSSVSSPSSIISTESVISIGSYDTLTANEFNGSIDEVRIYNRSLSASEVLDLYQMGTSYINWNAYTASTTMQDGVPMGSSNQGNFFQFKPVYTTNNTDVTSWVLNHSVGAGSQYVTDNIPPQWSNNKTNLTAYTQINQPVYFNITLTDNVASGYYKFSFYNGSNWINDSATTWTNNTQISVVKTLPISTGTINWTWYFNDSVGNSNQTSIFSLTLINPNTCPHTMVGAGTTANPYNVSTLLQLQGLQCNITATYQLVNNIDASDTRLWNNGAGFFPIGTSANAFSGNLYGNNYTISNLYVYNGSYSGLFGASGGTIRNLILSNVNVTGNNAVGGLVGSNNGTIYEVATSGTVLEQNAGFYQGAGGIAGSSSGTVRDSYSNATVTSNANYAGGVIGYHAFGNNVYNLYSTGNVTGIDNTHAGGLIGVLTAGSTVSNSTTNATVNNGAGNGVVGNPIGACSNIYWLNSTNNGANSGCSTGSTAKTSNLYFTGNVYPNRAPYNTWNFTGIWGEVNNSFPIFIWQGGTTTLTSYLNASYGTGTETSGSNLARSYIIVNVSAQDTINLMTITTYLSNSTTLLRTNITTVTGLSNYSYLNYSGLTDGTYYFNATVVDVNYDEVSLATRNVTLLAIPLVTIIYPTNTTYTTLINQINYSASSTGSLNKCWYSLDNGVTNSSVVNANTNFTSVPFVEGTNNLKVYCNDTMNNLGTTTVNFTIDLPPSILITKPSSTDQDLVFNVSISTSDTQGVSRVLYSLDNGANVTYTIPIDLYASAGNHIIRAYVNDTYGSWNSTSFVFTTKDHSAITICTGNQILLANGTCQTPASNYTYPCSGGQVLLGNGTCVTPANNYSYPCTGTQVLLGNGTCVTWNSGGTTVSVRKFGYNSRVE